jgi:hypothetical protein
VEKGAYALKNDDLHASGLQAVVECENAEDLEAREAEIHAQIQLLEARVRAARLAGA